MLPELLMSTVSDPPLLMVSAAAEPVAIALTSFGQVCIQSGSHRRAIDVDRAGHTRAVSVRLPMVP